LCLIFFFLAVEENLGSQANVFLHNVSHAVSRPSVKRQIAVYTKEDEQTRERRKETTPP